MEGSLLRVKLKRKLTYKGHYEYQFVDTMRIRKALQYLKQTHMHYKDVEFNEAWLNDFCRELETDVVEEDCDSNVDSNIVCFRIRVSCRLILARKRWINTLMIY